MPWLVGACVYGEAKGAPLKWNLAKRAPVADPGSTQDPWPELLRDAIPPSLASFRVVQRLTTERSRSLRTVAIPAVIVSILLVTQPARVAAEWVATRGNDSGCVLESSPESLSDGYQTTTARIRVDDTKVSISSPSVFDAGFNDIRIVVDEQVIVPMDRLADPRTAVFESRYGTLVEQFKRGLRARVQLRFWPTWPATGIHSATFSLIGFTRAHAQLAECK